MALIILVLPITLPGVFISIKRVYNIGSYTFYRTPVSLVYFRTFNSILQAIAFEKQLKSWSQTKKQALILGEFEKISLLAKKKFKKKGN